MLVQFVVIIVVSFLLLQGLMSWFGCCLIIGWQWFSTIAFNDDDQVLKIPWGRWWFISGKMDDDRRSQDTRGGISDNEWNGWPFFFDCWSFFFKPPHHCPFSFYHFCHSFVEFSCLESFPFDSSLSTMFSSHLFELSGCIQILLDVVP